MNRDWIIVNFHLWPCWCAVCFYIHEGAGGKRARGRGRLQRTKIDGTIP